MTRLTRKPRCQLPRKTAITRIVSGWLKTELGSATTGKRTTGLRRTTEKSGYSTPEDCSFDAPFGLDVEWQLVDLVSTNTEMRSIMDYYVMAGGEDKVASRRNQIRRSLLDVNEIYGT